MKTNRTQVFARVAAISVVCVLCLSAQAQDVGGTLYKAKCAICQGADGPKIAAPNLQGAGGQGMSDADLSALFTNGKGKMRASKSLTPEQVTGLVAYVRTLKK